MKLTRKTSDGTPIRCDGFVSSVSESHDLIVIADSPHKLMFNSNGFEKVSIKLVHPDFLTNDRIAAVQALINDEHTPRFPGGIRVKSYFFGNCPERSSLDLFEHFQSAYIPREEEEDQMTMEVFNLPDDLMRYFRNILDKDQLRAVEKSTSDIRNGVSLVIGPWGTGKSRTTAAIILVLCSLRLRVKVVCPTNPAVERIVTMVEAMLRALPASLQAPLRANIVRLYTSQVESTAQHFWADNASTRQDDQPIVSNIDLVMAIISEGENSYLGGYLQDAMVRSLAGHVGAFCQQNENDPDVQKYLRLHRKLKHRQFQGINATERADLHDLFESLASRILSEKIDIVFTTGGLTSNKLLRTAFATDFLVVDEAALMSVAEFTTCLTDEKTLSAVCLVADPHQGRPMSLSVSAKVTEFDGGMTMSIFQLFGDFPANEPVKLSTNYRSHPQLTRFPSTFYKLDQFATRYDLGKHAELAATVQDFLARIHLHRDIDPKLRKLAKSREIFFDIPSPSIQVLPSTSRFNVGLEVRTLQFANALLSHPAPPNGRAIRVDDIGIITFYKDSKAKLGAALSTVTAAGTKRLKLSTVDGFHGAEKPLILVNFVCADEDKPQGIAFIADALRLNVALSRAAKYNFYFGNLASWQEGIGIAAFEGFCEYIQGQGLKAEFDYDEAPCHIGSIVVQWAVPSDQTTIRFNAAAKAHLARTRPSAPVAGPSGIQRALTLRPALSQVATSQAPTVTTRTFREEVETTAYPPPVVSAPPPAAADPAANLATSGSAFIASFKFNANAYGGR